MIPSEGIKDKNEGYQDLIKQAKSLIDPDLDKFTNITTLLSLVKYRLGFFWVGIYLTRGDELHLGPFQGMPACTKIKFGKGVCGTAAFEQKIKIVDDVSMFEGYIACHSETKSEIVVPGIKDGKCIFVLDIDSTETGCFDDLDAKYLGQLSEIITVLL